MEADHHYVVRPGAGEDLHPVGPDRGGSRWNRGVIYRSDHDGVAAGTLRDADLAKDES